jgi:hypothetical protein
LKYKRKKEQSMKKRYFTFVSAAFVLALPLSAFQAFGQAQNIEKLPPNRLATNLPGATTAILPPDGFNPVEAADFELALYGFPPRPDASLRPKAFAAWNKAMSQSKTKVIPVLQQTTIFHGPAKSTTAPQISETTSTTSSNWSGVVDFSGATSYNSSSTYYYIYSDYVVPAVKAASCNAVWEYSSSWVGIDGYGSPDVLQAGTEADAYCSGSTTSTYYSAWYEWYPYGEVRVSSVPVAPGDDIYVEVWHTSSTQGYAYLVNENTGQYFDIGFTAYPGYPLVGNSAEWVVERPSVGGSLATLPKYTDDVFWAAGAETENSTFYTPSYSGAYLVSMSGALSYPDVIGPQAIWFYQ